MRSATVSGFSRCSCFFYAAYPLLAPHLVASLRTTIVMSVTTVGLLVLDQTVRLGFSLWLTMLGFFIGVHVGVNRLRLNAAMLNVMLVAIPLVIVGANVVFRVREFNMLLLLAFALTASLRLKLPEFRLGGLAFLVSFETVLLKIYLIHRYFFIYPVGNRIADFLDQPGFYRDHRDFAQLRRQQACEPALQQGVR